MLPKPWNDDKQKQTYDRFALVRGQTQTKEHPAPTHKHASTRTLLYDAKFFMEATTRSWSALPNIAQLELEARRCSSGCLNLCIQPCWNVSTVQQGETRTTAKQILLDRFGGGARKKDSRYKYYGPPSSVFVLCVTIKYSSLHYCRGARIVFALLP